MKELLPSIIQFREEELKYLNFKIDYLKAIGDNLELEVTGKERESVIRALVSHKGFLYGIEFSLQEAEAKDRKVRKENIIAWSCAICLLLGGFILGITGK